ncbi:hypothetical protein BLL42_28280 (plasmid) [Pseudomonas frederiksbergensis]|uniref:Uncharacterized protein n=1 Tax=Pseudomonas frederiksbergensis TaxID=104087 RepID=A0A1J0EUH1_9PSED|nr:ZirU family protein [Pseudomonas frederiksbergensis]APC19611.1 hypothetical protein BLL42_28280 [Pseudomonas frederiksbergensis]
MIKQYRVHALGFALGLVISGSAFAVVSTPTSAVKGRVPSMAAPTVTHNDVNANGVIDTGDTLTASDNGFVDVDGDVAIASTYRWSDGANNLGTDSVYTITASDLGTSITLYATPRTDPSITDPDVGAEVASAAAIDVAANNYLLSVQITGYTGNPLVASTLTAVPTCAGTCGVVSYQWQIEPLGGGAFVDIPSATSDTYTPEKGDQKRMIQVVAN